MLSDKEKAGMKSILAILDINDLQSLTSTLTKKQIAVNGRREYEEAILAFTETAKEFLHRRVFSKAVLVQYAYKQGMSLSEKVSREELIQGILHRWSSRQSQEASSQVSHQMPNVSSAPTGNAGVTVINNYQLNINVHNNSNPNPMLDLDRQFGEQFCHWFYDSLNHNAPLSQGFGPSSFLPGVSLKMRRMSPGFCDENVTTGSELVAKCLLELFNEYRLLPNYSNNGIQTKSDPHGLRMILVCGTLYRVSSLRGVFQQSFGLVQDPHQPQNWKIQCSELRLKETNIERPPQLEDFNNIPEIENNTISSLQSALVLRR